MEKETIVLLEKLFLESIKKHGVTAKRFRVDNCQHIQSLDELKNNQYIQDRDGKYYICLIPLLELSKINQKADNILFLCDLVFRELRNFYRQEPGESIKLYKIAKCADISRSDVNKALSYMVQSHIFGGYTTNFTEVEEASVTPGELILKFNSFSEVLKDIEKTQNSPLGNEDQFRSVTERTNLYEGHEFIDQKRIIMLKSLISEDFDFTRLITICSEMNSCAKNGSYLALGMLIRSLIDHVPPIFGERTFKELASSYALGKSVKKTFSNLEKSSRNISDGILHQAIGRTITIPTWTQVNFSPDIDVLIAEIIRKTEEN